MSTPEQLQKLALECLRLEADCWQLAGAVRDPNLQSHFVRMARGWLTLAVSEPSADAGRTFSAGTSQTA